MNQPRKIEPGDLTDAFTRSGLRGGDLLMMHASLDEMGIVEGGPAMVIHRMLRVIGDEGTLMMPAFTSISRHSLNHDGFTKPGCWCEGKEDRHVPFIPELQPDRNLGVVAHRLCSWPRARRSKHPGYSYVAVGKRSDEIVSEVKLDDPLLPVKKLLKYDPLILTIGVGLDAVTSIHLAEEKTSNKFIKEHALTISSKGRAWVDIRGLGCSNGFRKLRSHITQQNASRVTIGAADAEVYRMRGLVETARTILRQNPRSLNCENPACLNCSPLIRQDHQP